jgi:hypothetical protein
MDNLAIPSLVTEAWTTSFSGFPNFVWESKLISVNLSLKNWVKKSFNPPPPLQIGKTRKNREAQTNSAENRIQISNRSSDESRKRGTTTYSVQVA